MPSCPNCQSAVDSASRFCSACGTQVAAPATFPNGQPKSWKEFKAANAGKKPPKALTFIVFLVIVFGFVAVVHFIVSGSKSSGESAGPKAVEVSKAKIYGLNDSVTVGYWSYRANGIKWASRIGPEGLEQKADAKFLVLSLSVRNNDKTASTLPPVKLVDAQGREFEENGGAAMMLENAFTPLKQLNPTVQSNGLVVFDVPEGKYWAIVSGGMTSGEDAKIALN